VIIISTKSQQLLKILPKSISISLQQISHLNMTKEDRRKQIVMWTDLAELFELKKRCFMDAKQREIGGTMQVTNTSETFTLQ